MLETIITSSCSPNVHPIIVNAIVKTESAFNPFAIGVNRGASRLTRQPTNYTEAVTVAKRLLANGANIDMGLGQINSANMAWLNLSVEQAFHPCHNLKALQTVYLHCYNRAGETGKGTRMQRAFSCYNTGNMTGGFNNGYVKKITLNFNNLVAQNNQMATLPNNNVNKAPENAQNQSESKFDEIVPQSNVIAKNTVDGDSSDMGMATSDKPTQPNGNVFSFQRNSIFNQ